MNPAPLDKDRGAAHARRMSTEKGTVPVGTLTIELEDAATRRGWVGTLGVLAGSMQLWHFVGLVGDEARYESDTFSAPYNWSHLLELHEHLDMCIRLGREDTNVPSASPLSRPPSAVGSLPPSA